MSSHLLHLIWVLSLTEVRLRLRRLGTLVALMAVIAISWAMIPDPHSGLTLMAIKNARVLYTSSTLAFGSASLASFLFGLGGFYLVRGRIAEDLRSGSGAVIAATPVGNGLFLLSRALGGVLYLLTLIAALLGTMLMLHALHGEGPIQVSIYLQTYAVVFLPVVFLSVSCAILFDSIPVLMGKAGDLAFFFVWMAQIGVAGALAETHSPIVAALMLLDFSGLAISMIGFEQLLGTSHISVGMSTFNAALPAVTLTSAIWSAQVIWMRTATGMLALLPLLPAPLLFHRYSPDKVKPSSTRKRRSPLALINQWARPLAKCAQPLFVLGATIPGFQGQVLADLALTLAASPSVIALLGISLLASMLADSSALSGVLLATVACWGIVVSDLSTRDYQANLEQLTGTAAGGISSRYLRQFAAGCVLGWMFMGVLAIRLYYHAPVLGAALVSGVFSLAALATLFGRCSRTARTFLSLFLFWLYIASNETKLPMMDVVGFNGVANVDSVLAQLLIASAALFFGYVYNRQRAY